MLLLVGVVVEEWDSSFSRLSDYRGDTVVLAFFFRVRTRG